MLIDCDRCHMRSLACDDCVISVLLGPPQTSRHVSDEERQALDVLEEAGLVPPLRLVTAA